MRSTSVGRVAERRRLLATRGQKICLALGCVVWLIGVGRDVLEDDPLPWWWMFTFQIVSLLLLCAAVIPGIWVRSKRPGR